MTSRFKYARCLWLPETASYLLFGELISGEVSVGMELRFPLGGSAFVTVRVRTVESVEQRNANHSQIALGLAFRRQEEAELVCGRLTAGQVLEVGWPLRPRRRHQASSPRPA